MINFGCQPIQPGKAQTIDAAEGQSLRRFTSQHVELMTKRQDLCLQRRSRSEQSDQRQPNQAANISHQPRASPDSTALTSRIEFPTMTRDSAGSALKKACELLSDGCWDVKIYCPDGRFFPRTSSASSRLNQ